MESPDQAGIGRYAEQAIAADPNFGIPYLVLTELKLNQGDRAGATALLSSAASRGTACPERSHSTGDTGGQHARRSRAAGAGPYDTGSGISGGSRGMARVAEAATRRRDFPPAIDAYEHALAIEPEDVNTWNQLGYTAAFGGKLDTAMSALRRYQALRPLDPNPLDSMGDVNLMTGHLRDAERLYLEVYQKAPTFLNGVDLQKAAIARLMTGDVAGADAIIKGTGGAEWLWTVGGARKLTPGWRARRRHFESRQQGRAYAQLSLWSMMLQDRDTAAAMADKADSLATPGNSATIALARFVSLPSASPTEWAERAQRLFPNAPPNSIKDIALTARSCWTGISMPRQHS